MFTLYAVFAVVATAIGLVLMQFVPHRPKDIPFATVRQASHLEVPYPEGFRCLAARRRDESMCSMFAVAGEFPADQVKPYLASFPDNDVLMPGRRWFRGSVDSGQRLYDELRLRRAVAPLDPARVVGCAEMHGGYGDADAGAYGDVGAVVIVEHRAGDARARLFVGIWRQ